MDDCSCGNSCPDCEECQSPMCDCFCDYKSDEDDLDEQEQDW